MTKGIQKVPSIYKLFGLKDNKINSLKNSNLLYGLIFLNLHISKYGENVSQKDAINMMENYV
jgi:hypothetical protein